MGRLTRQLPALALLCSPLAATPLAAANLVANGSFELGNFVNTTCNYMQVNPGATDLSGWSVANGAIVWGRSTCDGYVGSDGPSFVDLSGFGATSPTAALSQVIATTPGALYQFSIDRQGAAIAVTLDGQPLSLVVTGSLGGWTSYGASFVAGNATSLLNVANASPGSNIVFVDNVALNAVPLPGAAALLVSGIAGLAGLRRRRRTT